MMMKINELSDTKTEITINTKKILIIGTAHISDTSVNEVMESIEQQKPDNICVELDEGRYKTIVEGNNWEQMNVSKILKEKKGFLLIANLVLSSFQKRMGVDVGTKPGEEMLQAITCAKEKNIPFTLADRNVHITLRRAWVKSGIIGKAKLLTALLGSIFTKEELDKETVEKLKERSALNMMMEELSAYLPAVKEVLIDERNQYLASNIYKAEGEKIIAVVGAGHVPGLIEELKKIENDSSYADQIKSIDVVPCSRWWQKAVNFVVPTLLLAAIAYVSYAKGIQGFAKLTIAWFFWNALTSGIGAIIALGNPLSILTAMIAAPFTSLGIPISSGVFAGIVESFIRKPKVEDMNRLTTDILTVKGVYKNRITRSLLVFFFSSVGSMIGTWAAGANILVNLFK